MTASIRHSNFGVPTATRVRQDARTRRRNETHVSTNVEVETERLEVIYDRGINGFMDVERDPDGNIV